MDSTLNFLLNAWRNPLSPKRAWWAFALVLLVIPLPLGFSNIALVLFVLASIMYCYKHRVFRFTHVTVVPMLLFLFMAASWFWSIDKGLTGPAISKELSLLLIPLGFSLLPAMRPADRQKILYIYGIGYAIFAFLCQVRAVLRYLFGEGEHVFYYHELVSLEVNAIHVSVFAALAFFVLISRPVREAHDYAGMAVLVSFIVFLSSKNVSLVFLFLVAVYVLFNIWGKKKQSFLILGSILGTLIFLMAFNKKLNERLREEYKTMFERNTINQEMSSYKGLVYNVSIDQAWNQEKFEPAQYFPGAAFRVYQARVFRDIMTRDKVWYYGYGLNASYPKIGERGKELNVYQGEGAKSGYNQLNFHNQYLQIFAELGVFALVILLWMLIFSLYRGFRNKDFVHISFTVLMITVFLTESFLWRQRGMTFFIALYCLFNAAPLAKRRIV